MADSYSLREVGELLGLSRRALQRRIDEGAFPGRFLASGRNGLETRFPAPEVEREVELQKRRGWRRESVISDEPNTPTITPARELESLVPYRTPELVESQPSGPSVGVA